MSSFKLALQSAANSNLTFDIWHYKPHIMGFLLTLAKYIFHWDILVFNTTPSYFGFNNVIWICSHWLNVFSMHFCLSLGQQEWCQSLWDPQHLMISTKSEKIVFKKHSSVEIKFWDQILVTETQHLEIVFKIRWEHYEILYNTYYLTLTCTRLEYQIKIIINNHLIDYWPPQCKVSGSYKYIISSALWSQTSINN